MGRSPRLVVLPVRMLRGRYRSITEPETEDARIGLAGTIHGKLVVVDTALPALWGAGL